MSAAASDPHVYECRVRWSDVDAYRHVNNVKYFEYFQEARIAFLSAFTPSGGTTTLVVARVVVDYRRPVFFRPEPYQVLTDVVRIGTSSFDLDARLVDRAGDDEVELARASAVLVGFDATTQRSRPLTEGERTFLGDRLVGAQA